jgi:hypothetical protein
VEWSLHTMNAKLLAVLIAILIAGVPDAAAAQPAAGTGAPRQRASRAPAKRLSAKLRTAPQIPPPEALIVLTRSAVLALHHANVTGNYTVLRDLGAPGFQSANSAAQLSASFTVLRDQRVDLSQAALLTPHLTQGPMITPQGLLGLAGYFAISPVQVNFQLLFQRTGGQWRLYGVSVSAVQTADAGMSGVRIVEPLASARSEGKSARRGKR